MTDYEERKAYLRGYSQGFRDSGNVSGSATNQIDTSKRDFCRTCGIDLAHAKAIDYYCRSIICKHPELKEHNNHE